MKTKHVNLRKILRSLILLAVAVVVAMPSPAFAVVDDFIDKFAANNIMFYNPDECEGGSGGAVVGGQAVISGSTAEEKVWSGLKSMGLTDEVVAGIMGNMIHESNYLNPAQHEGSFLNKYKGSFKLDSEPDIAYGLGLIQWSFGRRLNIYNYVKEKSPGLIKYFEDPMTYSYANGSVYGMNGDKFIKTANNENEVNALYSLELTFLVNEELKVDNNYSGVLSQTTVQGAADYFLENVEKPADIPGTRPGRRKDAQEIFSKYSGKSSFGAGSTGGSSSTSISGSEITVIGDSITDSSFTRKAYESKLAGADIYAKVSKHFSMDVSGNESGLTILKQLVSKSKVRNYLVFALGTNDANSVTDSQIKEVLDLVPDVKKIVFVTNFTTDNDYSKNNDAFKKVASENPGKVVVADWEATIKSEPGKYLSDGIHPKDQAASDKFVELIIQALGSDTGSSGSNSTCVCDDKSQTAGTFSGQKYNLTDGQIKGLLAMIKHENGGSIEAIKFEASIMANLFEHYKKSEEKTPENFVNYVKTTSWFAKGSRDAYDENFSNYTSIEWDAVVDVWRNGNRTLPPEVVEHDDPGDIKWIEVDGKKYTDHSNIYKYENYKPGKTKILALGDPYIFYTWANPSGTKVSSSSSGNLTGDPFGYLESRPPAGSSTGSTTGNRSESSVTWENGWIKGGMDGYVKEDANNVSGVLHEASTGDFTTDSPKGNGKGANKITLHSTEGGNAGGTSGLALFSKVVRKDGSGSGKTPSHFVIDIKNKKVFQHFAITQPSEAIKGKGSNHKVNDQMAGIQIEIIGYSNYDKKNASSEWYLPDENKFTDSDWDYLAKLLSAISAETGIPLTSSVDWDNPTRLSASDFKEYKGILGHMHTPADNDHVDPGGIWERVKAAIDRVDGISSGECSAGSYGDVAALQAKVLEFAWPEYHSAGWTQQKPAYTAVVKKGEYYHGGCGGNDCGGFVTTLMRESGWDPNYNSNGSNVSGGQYPYLTNKSNGWEEVTSKIKSNADAQPGDVIITGSLGHTLVYVGKINGFDSEMASASYSSHGCGNTRSPMADSAKDISYYINNESAHIFRKVK